MVNRGAWFYDPEGTFGSDLYQTLGKTPDQDLEIDARVRDALRDMTDIIVEDVLWAYTDEAKAVTLQVVWTDNPSPEESTIQAESGFSSETTVVIPVVPGGGV